VKLGAEQVGGKRGAMSVPLLGRPHVVCQSARLDLDVNEQNLCQAPSHVLPIAPAIDRM
jgi:hypothetical protein